jgi:hypothetical protein
LVAFDHQLTGLKVLLLSQEIMDEHKHGAGSRRQTESDQENQNLQHPIQPPFPGLGALGLQLVFAWASASHHDGITCLDLSR